MTQTPWIAALGALLALPASAAPCPVALPIVGEVSSEFGAGRRGHWHSGTDFRAPIGSPVSAAASGTVTHAGRYYAYGLMVEIEHPDGTRARYAHLARFAPQVVVGARVRGGEQIGILGRTGRTTGPNLHVELRRDGRAVDPLPWLMRAACVPGTELAEAPSPTRQAGR